MRISLIICFLSLLGNCCIAQEIDNVSDLRIKVDSILQYQIQYKIDSTTNVRPVHKKNATAHKGIHPAPNSAPLNAVTKVVLNGQPVKLENLDQYKLEDVAEIKVFPKNDPTAMALYGSSARNGLILIRLKK